MLPAVEAPKMTVRSALTRSRNPQAVVEVAKLTVPWAPTKQKNRETVVDKVQIGIVDTE